MDITELSANETGRHISDLTALLEDAVNSGASIGFLPPLASGEAEAYWTGVIDSMHAGGRVHLAAIEDGRIIGSVQLDYAGRRNASHRAEVMKLMVHTAARRRGVGRLLMQRAAEIALSAGRTLLVLDTRCGDPSETLYTQLGYVTAGVIPGYARSASGDLHSTVIMYRHLG